MSIKNLERPDLDIDIYCNSITTKTPITPPTVPERYHTGNITEVEQDTNTVINDYTPLVMNNYVTYLQNEFQGSTIGRITYQGTTNKPFQICCDISSVCPSGNNLYEFALFKVGNTTPYAVTPIDLENIGKAFSVNTILSLAPSDEIYVQVKGTTGHVVRIRTFRFTINEA